MFRHGGLVARVSMISQSWQFQLLFPISFFNSLLLVRLLECAVATGANRLLLLLIAPAILSTCMLLPQGKLLILVLMLHFWLVNS